MTNRIQALRVVSGIIALLSIADVHALEFNQFDPAHSHMQFTFKQMNVPIDGSFKQFNAQLSFNPDKPTTAKAEITIALSSIDAGSDEANDEVAGKLWFNTKEFPNAHFVATAIKSLGKNRFDVSGTMTIKGKSLPVSTPATFHQDGKLAIFEGSFNLKRADFGLGEGMWADFGTVANDIQIKFKLAATAASK